MNIDQIQILGNRVLVEQIAINAGSIIVPLNAKTVESNEFIILKLGDGDRINPKLKAGQRVSMMNLGHLNLGDRDTKRGYRIYSTEDVIAILEEPKPEKPFNPVFVDPPAQAAAPSTREPGKPGSN